MKSKYIHTPPFPSHFATKHYKRSTDRAKQFIITTSVGELTFGTYSLWVKEFHSSKLRSYFFCQYGQRSLKRTAWGVSSFFSVRTSEYPNKISRKGCNVQNSGAFCLKMSSLFQLLEDCVIRVTHYHVAFREEYLGCSL